MEPLSSGVSQGEGPLTCITHIHAGQLNNKATAAFLKAVRNYDQAGKEIGIVKAFDLHNYVHNESPTADQNESSVIVIDCRSTAEFDAGHIDGALSYPMKFPPGNVTFTRIGSDPQGGPSGPLIGTGESDTLQPSPKSLVLHYTKPSSIKQVVFYCSEDQIRSSALAFWFMKSSHAPGTQLLVLFGGLEGWQQAGGLVHVPDGASITPPESPTADESTGLSQKNQFQRGMSLRRAKTRPRALAPFSNSLNQAKDQSRMAPQDFSQSILDYPISNADQDSNTINNSNQDAAVQIQTISETTTILPNGAGTNTSADDGDVTDGQLNADTSGTVNPGDDDRKDNSPAVQSNHADSDFIGSTPPTGGAAGQVLITQNSDQSLPTLPSALSPARSQIASGTTSPSRMYEESAARSSPKSRAVPGMRRLVPVISVQSTPDSVPPGHQRQGSDSSFDNSSKSNHIRGAGSLDLKDKSSRQDRFPLAPSNSLQPSGAVHVASLDLKSDKQMRKPLPSSGQSIAPVQRQGPQETVKILRKPLPSTLVALANSPHEPTPSASDARFNVDADEHPPSAVINASAVEQELATQKLSNEGHSAENPDETDSVDADKGISTPATEDDNLGEHHEIEHDDSSDYEFVEEPIPRATHKWYPGTEPEGHEIFLTNFEGDIKTEDQSLFNKSDTEESGSASEFVQEHFPRATHKWYPGTEPEGHEIFLTDFDGKNQKEEESVLNESAAEESDSDFVQEHIPRATHKWYPGTEPEGHEIFLTSFKDELEIRSGDQAIHNDKTSQRVIPGVVPQTYLDDLGQDELNHLSPFFAGGKSIDQHGQDKSIESIKHEQRQLEKKISHLGGGKQIEKDTISEITRGARNSAGDYNKLNPISNNSLPNPDAERGRHGSSSRGMDDEPENEPDRLERHEPSTSIFGDNYEQKQERGKQDEKEREMNEKRGKAERGPFKHHGREIHEQTGEGSEGDEREYSPPQGDVQEKRAEFDKKIYEEDHESKQKHGKHERHHNAEEGSRKENLMQENGGDLKEKFQDKDLEIHEKSREGNQRMGKVDEIEKASKRKEDYLPREFGRHEKRDKDNGEDRGLEKEPELEKRHQESGGGEDELRDENYNHHYHHQDKESKESVQEGQKMQLDQCSRCGSHIGFGVEGPGVVRINAERVSGEMDPRGSSYFLLRLSGTGNNDLSVWKFHV